MCILKKRKLKTTQDQFHEFPEKNQNLILLYCRCCLWVNKTIKLYLGFHMTFSIQKIILVKISDLQSQWVWPFFLFLRIWTFWNCPGPFYFVNLEVLMESFQRTWQKTGFKILKKYFIYIFVLIAMTLTHYIKILYESQAQYYNKKVEQKYI